MPNLSLESHMPIESWRARALALSRGARGRCPNCGKGNLLYRYLKVSPECTACGEAYGHISADDMPPWLTIAIVGHLMLPQVWYVQRTFDIPLWAEQILWPVVALVMLLFMLPRCKGACVALLWLLPRLPPSKEPEI